MIDQTSRNVTMRLVEAVHALLRAPQDGPRFYELARAALDRCEEALRVTTGHRPVPPAIESTPQRALESADQDIGRRIAELRVQGHGVREIARMVGVNASTVSRRLRKH